MSPIVRKRRPPGCVCGNAAATSLSPVPRSLVPPLRQPVRAHLGGYPFCPRGLYLEGRAGTTRPCLPGHHGGPEDLRERAHPCFSDHPGDAHLFTGAGEGRRGEFQVYRETGGLERLECAYRRTRRGENVSFPPVQRSASTAGQRERTFAPARPFHIEEGRRPFPKGPHLPVRVDGERAF